MPEYLERLTEFGGLPVFDFPDSPDDPVLAGTIPADAESVAWRVAGPGFEVEVPWPEHFARFCEHVDTTRVRAFVAGSWGDLADGEHDTSDLVIEAMVAARDRFPALRAIFLGDIEPEEAEISWIRQGPVSALLAAFPDLTEFVVRGSDELSFAPIRHERLEKLTMQAGGLPGAVVRDIAACDFPALTHLDLWLGTPHYLGDATIADLAPILTGDRLPGLKYLALRNSDIQDDICAALATAPVVARLDTLDVSMGVLTDTGAAALLAGQPLTHLKTLDMHHNYLSPELCARLRETLEPAVSLDLDPDDAESYTYDGEVHRYISVSE
ncbi:STM4015 family protein [Nocardia carnea]|uniref:STM4015 family protein n=1 Tax=Nocardia carnea TaxID=37328 RepID=UPI0024565624|nr:STM4015 family protein [Nocardia carnea]